MAPPSKKQKAQSAPSKSTRASKQARPRQKNQSVPPTAVGGPATSAKHMANQRGLGNSQMATQKSKQPARIKASTTAAPPRATKASNARAAQGSNMQSTGSRAPIQPFPAAPSIIPSTSSAPNPRLKMGIIMEGMARSFMQSFQPGNRPTPQLSFSTTPALEYRQQEDVSGDAQPAASLPHKRTEKSSHCHAPRHPSESPSSRGEGSSPSSSGQHQAGSFPTRTLEPWQQLKIQEVLNSIDPATLRSYERALQVFLDSSGSSVDQGALTFSKEAISRHLDHLRTLRRSVKTMRRFLAAVSFFCRATGLHDPSTSFLAQCAVKRRARTSARRVNVSRQVSRALLSRLVNCLPAICLSQYEVLLFRAAFTLSFFGPFHSSEVVSDTCSDTSGRALAVGDVEIEGDVRIVGDVRIQDQYLCIWLRHCKTDQNPRGIPIALHPSRDGGPCPVAATAAYLAARPAVAGPLLIHEDASYLSQYQLATVFRKALDYLGLSSSAYKLRSLCRGATPPPELPSSSD